MSLKANLKRFFLSPWFYILFVPIIALSVMIYMTSGSTISGYVRHLLIINVFLTVFITVFSAYAARSIREIEWSVKSRAYVIANGIAAANIFCLSALSVPVIFIVFGCIQKGLPFELAVNYIFFIVCLTLAQTVFLSALGFLLGTVIKNKTAYACAVLLSIVFTPFAQNFLTNILNKTGFEKDMVLSSNLALTNLINISWDDTSRPKYAGYGMPFNSETILSWIITVLAGIILILALVGGKRCFKLKGTAALFVLLAAVTCSGAYCFKLYFEASPTIRVYDNQYVMDFDGSPIKPDTAHIYSDPDSPVISRYEMKLDTGNTVKSECELELNVNNNSSVKLRLDECFKIHSLTVNGEKTDYEREKDYFTVALNPSEERAVIALEYSGRMNYAGVMHSKIDVCNYTGGYLSGMFAWYPKLLSSQNCEVPKTFTVEINAVNRFVTNLDGYTLHSSGKQTVKGEKTDIMFYLGYLSEINDWGGPENDFKIILPTEYAGNDRLPQKLTYIIDRAYEIKTYKDYFTRQELLELEDFKKTETSLISYEELKAFTENRLKKADADKELTDEVNVLLTVLKDFWNDSLIEKLENNKYVVSEEMIAVDDFLFALSNTEKNAPPDLSDVKTIIIIPYSYNTTLDTYIFQDSIIASEGCIA